MLAFFVNSLVVSNYTPEAASELPVIGNLKLLRLFKFIHKTKFNLKIGVYYTFNIFLVAFALSGTVFILKLHFRGHKLNKVIIYLIY